MAIQTNSASVTAALGHWTAELTLRQVPGQVISQIKRCLLDTIGCGLYGALQPWGRITADVAVGFSAGGPSSLFARTESVSPPDAALANGTAIHGFEIDDAHVSSSLHPGAVTLPAALAVAQQQRATGTEFLTALVAGYEIGLRVGVCAGVSHSTSGYHVTGTAGTLASAAAAAKLLRLDAEGVSHALAIAATQAAGLYAARFGAMTKRFHAGRAAQSGVIAAYLASKKFTGSPDALEAPFGGFLSTLQGQHKAETMLDGLGTTWETERVGLKPYAACASAHTTIDGVRELRGAGLTADNLAQMTIRVSKKSAINIGWPYVPAEVMTAQMNGQYAAAVTLLDGDAFIDQYAPSRLADPKILKIIPRVAFVHDPEIDLGGADKRHTVKIDAVLTDGSRLLTTIEQRRGSSHYPLSDEEISRKFHRLARVCLSDAEQNEIAAISASIERAEHLKRFTQLIAGCRSVAVHDL
jgi:aconitate decarboxylase